MPVFDDLLDRQQLLQKIDSVVAGLLEKMSLTAPPVNSFEVARFLGWEIILDQSQSERGRLKRIGGRLTIFLQPDERKERMQWALAHEIGESLSSNWISLVEEQELKRHPELREELANIFATRLLLPKQWFQADAGALNGDLLQLKELYQTASHQLIAQRLLDQDEISYITIFDEGRITSRFGNSGNSAPALQPFEKDCWIRTHHSGEPAQAEQQGMIVECWPVHEPDFKREVLRTRPMEFFE